MTSSISSRYRIVAGRLADLMAAVPADRWSSPSPCSDWSAADVAEHVVATEADLLGRMDFATPDGLVTDDVSTSWDAVRTAVQDALDDPMRADHEYDGYFGPTTFAQTIDRFYTSDIVIHTWDLARAAGLPQFEPIEEVEMERIVASYEGLGDMMRQPGLLGPAIDVDDEASEQTKFLAFYGRNN
jgi:uncharacterized protein (TIGR03086 family)